jgi:hypothetical protein
VIISSRLRWDGVITCKDTVMGMMFSVEEVNKTHFVENYSGKRSLERP